MIALQLARLTEKSWHQLSFDYFQAAELHLIDPGVDPGAHHLRKLTANEMQNLRRRRPQIQTGGPRSQ